MTQKRERERESESQEEWKGRTIILEDEERVREGVLKHLLYFILCTEQPEEDEIQNSAPAKIDI